MRIFGLDITRTEKRGIVTPSGVPFTWPIDVSTPDGIVGAITFLDTIYQTIASEFSKLDFFPVRDKAEDFIPREDLALYRAMTLRPNVAMTASEWLWIVAYHTMRYGHSLTRIIRDHGGNVVGLEPVAITDWEFGKGYITEDNTFYIKVRSKKRNRIELWRYTDLIHIRLNPNSVFSAEKSCGLDGAGGIVRLFDRSLEKMLKEYADGTPRGVIKVGSSMAQTLNQTQLSKEAKVAKQAEMKERLKEAGRNGLVILDSVEDWHDIAQKSIEAEQIKTVLGYITTLKGVSEKVIAGTASEKEMEVFFAKSVMPIVEQFTEECTYKLFSQTAITQGNKITFTRNMFEYISATSAMDSLYKGHMDLTVNEVRKEVYGKPPIEGGDKLLNNKNFEQAEEEGNEKGGVNNAGQ
jgi:HK97 family phage portal protein